MQKEREYTPEEIEEALKCWTEGPEQPFQKYEPIPISGSDEKIFSLGQKIYNTIRGYNIKNNESKI